jgi:NDP-sugar pyrophosphorylase family protein
VITKDVISRRCLPFVVEFPVFNLDVRQVHFNRYYGSNVKRHVKSDIGNHCVVGSDTRIGENAHIINSVIGSGCVIGNGVEIRDCIVWDNVVICDNCKIDNSLIADSCVIGANSTINKGCMIDKNV